MATKLTVVVAKKKQLKHSLPPTQR